VTRRITALALVYAFLGSVPAQATTDEMPWVAVSKDKKGFVLDPSGCPFVPWGFNYDHDAKGRLSRTIGTMSGPLSRRTSAR
jgi:hypothetical protein